MFSYTIIEATTYVIENIFTTMLIETNKYCLLAGETSLHNSLLV